MLTEDNANVETEITDNDVTAMLSAFNTGNIKYAFFLDNPLF